MNSIPLRREVLFSRISEIEGGLEKLARFQNMSFDQFQHGEH